MEAGLLWREGLVFVQGEESQRILLKGRIVLTMFSPPGEFCPGKVPTACVSSCFDN